VADSFQNLGGRGKGLREEAKIVIEKLGDYSLANHNLPPTKKLEQGKGGERTGKRAGAGGWKGVEPRDAL